MTERLSRVNFLRGGLAAGLLLAAAPALAQDNPNIISDDPVSREVVQPLPPQAAADLSAALRLISRNPQDGKALLAAGWASLELENIDAAVGFFARAEDIPAYAGEAKAGLGAVQVSRKRPVEALQLFDEAERLGARLGPHASERGLAYDLVGDNARAQGFYREALAAAPGDQETIKRLALSQAIGGDQNSSETTLLPLLQHGDLAAYRTRAFALAALGKAEEAVSIANAVMPASLAGRIAPYLRYMPKLTKAQQAAAGNFGHFPEADAIGRDDARIAEYTGQAQPSSAPAVALDARLTPAGAPLGDAPTPAPPPAAVVAAAQVAEEPRPSISVAAAPVRTPVEPPPAPVRLADAFADFKLQSGSVTPAPGAVDITKIEPAREPVKKPEPEVKKPPKPVHPSRVWVQVATGRDKSALGFDWRRMNREEAKLLSGKKAYVVKWGQTNRLVTGPFSSQKEAAAYVTQLKKAGIDSFTFTSDEGEAVDPLPGG